MKAMKKHTSFRKLSIWAQLTLLVSCIVTLAFGLIIYTTYTRQVHSYIQEYKDSTCTILDMESANLDQYIRDLRAFCVRPCLNVPVYNSLLRSGALTNDEQDAIRQELQAEYHSRTDLRAYAITALGTGIHFERPVGGQHVQVYSVDDIRKTHAYLSCGDNDKYEYIAPAENDKTFFRYYHYLIRLRNREPVSLSYIDLDTTQLKLLLSNHRQQGEAVCLYNRYGELIYTNLDSLLEDHDAHIDKLYTLSQSEDHIRIGGSTYLLAAKPSSETGLLLVSLMPQRTIASRARDMLNPMLVMAIVIIIVLIAVITIVLHLITDPLAKLSAQMSRMASGDFSPFRPGSGCRESDALTESYNDMALRLNELIETNYIAHLNEKNARLKALEAQLNPHFLYNTLQAIATEALMDDSPQVYDMIVSLAGNLRYTIKGSQIVRLDSEMTYVRSYMLLQKTRLGERMIAEEHISPDALSVMIPKISIQILVENALIHGMRPDGSPLHLTLTASTERETLLVTVRDNGTGIEDAALSQLRQQLCDPRPLQNEQQSIGLINLASRLRILYQGRADLSIDSVAGRYTAVTMQIPLKEETHDPNYDH